MNNAICYVLFQLAHCFDNNIVFGTLLDSHKLILLLSAGKHYTEISDHLLYSGMDCIFTMYNIVVHGNGL